MNDRYTHPDERQLARALKAQADDSAPAFSPLLHERIMKAVRSAPPAMGPASGLTMGRWLSLAAAAAAVLLGVWIWNTGWAPTPDGASRPPEAPQMVQMPNRSVEQLLQSTQAAGARLQARLEEGQMAYLDRDAEKFTRFVIDQVRAVPGGR